MRVFGVDLPRESTDDLVVENTLVLLDDRGRIAQTLHLTSLPEVAATVAQLADQEPFLLGVNAPIVVPPKPSRARPVEGVVRRRLGVRLPPGGRAALDAEPGKVAGETLMAGLAAAGRPCLPYPDRDLRQPSLAESAPVLVLKALLWEASRLSGVPDLVVRGELFRAFSTPEYRATRLRARTGWAEQAARLDLVLSALGAPRGYDLDPARDALTLASTRQEVERAASLFDAALIAGTARRYLDAPETCVFVGDPQQGYLVLPADAFIRRLAVASGREPRDRLFPRASLTERLGDNARLRAVGLLAVPGRPQQTEASFSKAPRYEFDNVDEMLWWKHCRHLAGPALPTEGLQELTVSLGPEESASAPRLRLIRSRHRTLSFRFEPPAAWRTHVPTRDGGTYPFFVLRAVYDTL